MNRFAIIDIETTGTQFNFGKITEIAIIVYENKRIVAQYETLINPECTIPYEITRITGITNELVKDSPKFYEIAKEVIDLTHGCIFVAHNVSFDYSFIKEEFKNLGYSYIRKRLCTVKLSKKYYPGLHSYSLGNLIKHFNIPVKERHRAMEDAKATLQVFERMLDIEEQPERLKHLVSGMIQQSKLPIHVTIEEIDSLPEECGVYYMSDDNGRFVYIGKSKNIKSRIIQHFNEVSYKNTKMNQQVYSIAYKITGSELMASLLESQEIKIYNPEINRAQKVKKENWALLLEITDEGYYKYRIQNIDKIKSKKIAINLFKNSKYAQQYLDYLIHEFNLCLSIQRDKSNIGESCTRNQMGFCLGACQGRESKESYNERFLTMNEKINKFFNEDIIIIDCGRSKLEKSIVIIENGFCSFFGYLDYDIPIFNLNELKEQLEKYKGNIETNGIIRNFLKKNPKTIKIRCNEIIDTKSEIN
ncbi:MAG: GIY-YIG nuclease family protein [Saprospiraceae bacterium]|nr:GIY-YIG nuclease family protein [Saprospiraceae bacterium]